MDASALIKQALLARAYAYAPYSGFCVGAALLCADGTVYTGCNIENSAYSPTNCAERTAVFKAVSEGKRGFTALAVVGGQEEAPPTGLCTPCGVCRQVMAEFCQADFVVLCAKTPTEYQAYSLQQLLPAAFALE